MEAMKAIANRQSCRTYTGEQLTQKELQTILEAANASPVGMAKFDEVKLTVIQNKEFLGRLDKVGADFMGNPDLRPTYGAPTIILVSAIKPSDPQNPSSYCNAACIVENMAIAASDLGLGSVYLLGVIAALRTNAELCADLKVPEEFIPVSAIALGRSKEPLIERSLTTSKIVTEYLY